MSTRIQQAMNAWLTNGHVSDTVVELFRLIGREITDTTLTAAKDQTQEWRRPEDKQRWELPNIEVDDGQRFLQLAEELLLYKPWSNLDDDGNAIFEPDILVIPGATYRAMTHRAHYAIRHAGSVNQFIITASHRPARQDELDLLAKHKFLTLENFATEAKMARLLLARMDFAQHSVLEAVISSANMENGKPARTDETIAELVNFAPMEAKILFGLHAPYAVRQMATIERILTLLKFSGEREYVAAEPLGPKEGVPFSVNNGFVQRLADEAIRMIYELEQMT